MMNAFTSAGGTPAQIAARRAYRDLTNFNPFFNRLANKSIDFEGALRPDSSFSQDNLDTFNRRQAEARQQFANIYGKDALEDVKTYTRVEDIPRYTEEDIKQQNIERLKANPKSFYNRKNTPLNERFDQPNQKVPQAVVDSYNSLIDKFRNLRDTGDQSSVREEDFTNVLNALKDSPAEYIKPGEKYLGPAFKDTDGTLLRDNPKSIFFGVGRDKPEATPEPFAESAPSVTRSVSPVVSETPEIGKARETGIFEDVANSSGEREAKRQQRSTRARKRRSKAAKVASMFKNRRRTVNNNNLVAQLLKDF